MEFQGKDTQPAYLANRAISVTVSQSRCASSLRGRREKQLLTVKRVVKQLTSNFLVNPLIQL